MNQFNGWTYNPNTKRLELWDSDRKSLIAVFTTSASKTDDLPNTVIQSTLPSSVSPLFERGDINAIQGYVSNINQLTSSYLTKNQSQAQQPEQASVWDPMMVKAIATQYSRDADNIGTARKIQQAEIELRRDMMQSGVDPDRFFKSYSQQGQLRANATPTSINGYFDPEVYDALGSANQAGFNVAIQARLGQLQNISNQWENTKIGINRMNYLRESRLNMDQAQQAFNIQTQQAQRDPHQDSGWIQVQNPDGTTTSIQGYQLPAWQQMNRMKKEQEIQQRTWYPEQMAAQDEKQRQAREWLTTPLDQRVQKYGQLGYQTTMPDLPQGMK